MAELWLQERRFMAVALRKQEIEIEQSDTVVAGFLRARGIGFGAIRFQSL
jgi:hypothetical protein